MKKELFAYLLAASAMLIVPGLAFGQSTFTGGGDGSTWDEAENWDNGIPTANANIGDAFTVNLATTQTIAEFDLVGDQSSGTAILNHSAGTLTGSGWVKVGGGPDGGGGAATDGTYNLSGTAAVTGFADTFIGFRGGTGALSLSDSASLVVGSIRLAAEGTDTTGAMTVADDASLTAENINMGGGAGAAATVDQTGGTVTSSTWVAITNFGAGGTGTYSISAGSLSANDGNIAVGQEGTGTLNVSGTAVVSQATASVNKLFVGGLDDNGFVQDGTGTLGITGSSASISAADFHVGASAASTGTVSWTADAGGITEIVSADNSEFGPGAANLVLDLTADANSSVDGTEYLLVDNGAAVAGTFTGLAEGATVGLGGGNSGTISYAGGADGFDIVVTAGGGAGVAGDFNGDGNVDCDDLDGYVGNIGAAATGALAALDVNGNGTLEEVDANTHIADLIQTSNGVVGTFPGDLNCDGEVNVLGDAFALVANLGNMNATSYSQGDINFDGMVNVLGDAFSLVANLGRSNNQ